MRPRHFGALQAQDPRVDQGLFAHDVTILSYRWDTYENNEVFVGCADIAITTDGDAAPVTPRPTLRPTKAAVATPRPTLRPTKGGIEWNCAGYSQSCHRVDHNNGDAFKALGSTTSWGSESVCTNKGKRARWSTHWCPKQDLTCTKANSCRRLDGKTGKMTTTTKWKQSKCLAQGETARWTTVWCPADVNGKVGGIMFWAVNEGASGGPNGNGQTTGQNSVALANYAAAL